MESFDNEDNSSKIKKMSDKKLNKYILDTPYDSPNRKYANEELNRRQINKIGKNTWLTIITFGIIVLTLIFTVLAFFFK